MNAIEQLMDVLWNESVAGNSVARSHWTFTPEFLTELKAAATPSCDPFGPRGETCLGLPYSVVSGLVNPYMLIRT